MINGLMVDDLATGAVFHALTWFSKRSKRPVQSVVSADVLGISATADEDILLNREYRKILGVNIDLFVIVDSKDLYKEFTNRQNNLG